MPAPSLFPNDELDRRVAALPPERARLVYLSAIPLWLDSEFLLALHGSREQAAAALEMLEQLLLLSRVAPNRAIIRPEVRRHLLHTGWRRQLPDYASINLRLAGYCFQRFEQEPDAERRLRWARAGTYHLLAAGEAEGWRWLARLYDDAEARGLTGTALQLLEPLAELRPILSHESRATLAYYRARAALAAGQIRKAKCLFRGVIAQGQPMTVVGVAHRGLGRALAAQQRWSEALWQFRRSEQILSKHGDNFSLALTRQGIGDMYQEMAEFSGGIVSVELIPAGGRLTQWIRNLTQLPLLLYRESARRIQRLPFIDVGFNYQNWATARLMLAAATAYQHAVDGLIQSNQDPHTSSPQALYEARLGLARVYTKVGMHRRAERLLNELESWDYVEESEYRLAQVNFRRADLAEARGQISHASSLLQEIIKVYATYQQRRGLAVVYQRLGNLRARNGEDRAAVTAYLEAAKLYAEMKQFLSRTVVLNRVAGLIDGELPDDDGHREYLARFPNRLASLYRRLAYSVALPPLVLGALIFIGLLNALIRVEYGLLRGELALSALAVPFVMGWLLGSGWLFQILYLFIGLTLSWGLPIGEMERDPPLRIALDATGLSLVSGDTHKESHIAWEDIAAVQVVDYRVRLRPIVLFSHLDILANRRHWRISALTIDYEHLHDQLQRRLSATNWQRWTFVVIFHPWNYAIAMFLIPAGLLFQQVFQFAVRPDQPAPTTTVEWTLTDISGIFLGAVIAGVLLFPLVTFWRLAFHQWQLWFSTPPAFPRPRPSLGVHLAAALWTVLTILYLYQMATLAFE